VVSPHGGYAPASLARNAARKRVYQHLVERPMLRRAALRVALSEIEARDLAAFGAGEPITVIPNGVAPAPTGVDGTAFRRELGLAPHERLLLFVGRLDVRHKGLDLLLRGAAEAPGWRLALVGPDHRGGRAWLLEQARRLGMPERLAVLGPRNGPSLHEAFAAADCFALTSRWEGLPISLLEALAHGIPAVVSPTVDRLVGVVAAGAGWSASPEGLGALLRSLSQVTDEWERRRVSARALASRYDWSSIARRYEAAYAGVLEKPPR
jgi:glycosyltransferase involved in cell wall biosynthesis